MQLFLRGIVLPFQKGSGAKRKIQKWQSNNPVRVPFAKPDANFPDLAGADGSPISQGQPLCNVDGAPVLSTVSGTLNGTVVINHPLHGELLCAEIQPKDALEDLLPVVSEQELTPEAIIRIATQAAVFDELDGTLLAEKLLQWQLPAGDPAGNNVILVADATENDIFGSSSWAVLGEDPKTAFFGLQMAARALNFSRCHIATMLPGRRRRELKKAIGKDNVYIVGDEYPVTVFADGRADVFRIGIQACFALGQALKTGKKHTTGVVTIAGDALHASRNMRVPFGTEIGHLLAACGAEENCKVVLGDAMTGITCTDMHTPLLPDVTTILALKQQPIHLPGPCIGCGRCASVCHAELLPYEIVRRLENMHYERLRHLAATDCDGCAACSYVCPAYRNVAGEVLRARQSNGTMFLSWGDDENV